MNLPQLHPGDIILMDSAASQSASWFGRQITKAIKWRTRKIGEEPTQYAHAAMFSRMSEPVYDYGSDVTEGEILLKDSVPLILEMTQPRGREAPLIRGEETKGTKIAVYRYKHFQKPIEPGEYLPYMCYDGPAKTTEIGGKFTIHKHLGKMTVDEISDIISGKYVVDRMREICIKPNGTGRKYGYIKIGGFWMDGFLTNVKQLFKRNGDVRLFTRLTKAHVCSTAVAAAYESVGIKCHPYSSPWQANPDDIDDYCRESDDWQLICEGEI